MPLRELRWQAPEVELNYAAGPSNGPSFVLLHGGGGRWQHGQALLELLASDWHVYSPDFRGHGKSGHVAGAYLLRDYVRDVAAFLGGVVGEAAVVFGHSLGGEVAVMLAAEHPALVRALIVGDAPLSLRNHGTEEPRHRAANVAYQRLAGRPAAEIETALRDVPLPVPGESGTRPARELLGEDDPWFALHARTLEQLDPDMLAAVLAGPEVMLAGYDPYVLLPKIACGVLLVQADPAGALQGGVLTDEDVALALSLLSDVTHLRLEGIGHPLHGPPENTARVLEAITPFLSACR